MLKKSYLEKMEARLHVWNREIERLKSRVENSAEETRKMLSDYFDELVKKEKAVRKRLQDVRDATGKSWGHLKDGVEKAFRDLRKGIDRVIDTLRKAA